MHGHDPRVAGTGEACDAARRVVEIGDHELGFLAAAPFEEIGHEACVFLIHRGDETAGIGMSFGARLEQFEVRLLEHVAEPSRLRERRP